ncbi:MAG: ABC transporter ATP-binding protein [Actinomycetota bacterium]|nr:ABC transporter ATP-binding protein [Actinomycetota bacterium]
MEAVLRVESLRKSYYIGWRKPRREALNGLNLEVSRGSIVGLLGPNGAGKTTTLKSAIGLVRPEEGRIRVFDEDGVTAESRRKMGFLPEQPYFDLYLTPRKLLMYYGRLAGIDARSIRSRISHLLGLVSLEEETDIPMVKLSKGMLQRLGFAQALLSEPDFLILDEPSAGLDPLGKVRVRDLLEDLRGGGTSILLSSHQLSDIEEICDGVALIDQGRNIASGSLDELLESKEEMEIVLEDAPPHAIEKLPSSAAWAGDDEDRIILHKRDLNPALKALVEAGAVIGGVVQRRMTLEEFFLARVGKGTGESE